MVTIEPILDFDLNEFATWIESIRPDYVWLGFNSKPESVTLPEPPEENVQQLAEQLIAAGIKVRGKTLRSVTLPNQASNSSGLGQADLYGNYGYE